MIAVLAEGGSNLAGIYVFGAIIALAAVGPVFGGIGRAIKRWRTARRSTLPRATARER